MPLLRAVLPCVPRDGAPDGVPRGGSPLPGEPVSQLRRVSLRVSVRAAASVWREPAAGVGRGTRGKLRTVLLAAAAGEGLSRPGWRRGARTDGHVYGAPLDRCASLGSVSVEPGPGTRRLLCGDAARRDGGPLRPRVS